MPRRALLVLVFLLSASFGVGSCFEGPHLLIVSPEEGQLVSGSSVDVSIALDAVTLDPGSLVVTVNDQAVPATGGPKRWTVNLPAGLLGPGENRLEARADFRETAEIEVAATTFLYGPPKAALRRITDPADLMEGPLAHGRVGDYLLENDLARFIIQDVAQRDMWSIGQFGGNLIDAELRSDPGRENFLELQPALNVESVINAQTAEIVNDGTDGNAAILRTCGPDDLLDFINVSTNLTDFGFALPASADDVDYAITGCTEYVLAPDKPYLKLVTTVTSDETTDLGLFVGDFINAAGEVDPWAISAAVPGSRGGIAENLAGSLRAFTNLGFGDAERLDYSLVPIPFEGASAPSDFLTAAGVTGLLQNTSLVETLVGAPPPFVVPAGGSKSFTRYFAVGDGSGTALELEIEVRGLAAGSVKGCVTVGGAPAPGSRVAVVRANASDEIRDLISHFVTDLAGCYDAQVPTGSYGLAAWRRGTPYEGGGSSPVIHRVDVAEGAVVTQDMALPATGRLRVDVVDAAGAPLPARITVVGFDPSPEPSITVALEPLGTFTSGIFKDRGKDDLAFGLVAMDYAGAEGVVEIDLEPGSYQVFVSRGFEYSLFDAPISVEADATATVSARIDRVLDTTGFVSSDFHIHGLRSPDSRIRDERRVSQFAGEGVDNLVMTDHNARTDVTPTVTALGLTPFVHATVGEEITTWDYGHFNGYPLEVDPSRVSGGSTDWGFQDAAPGEAFPSAGAFTLTPQEMDQKARTGVGSTPATLVQINHIETTFPPLKLDTSLVPPRTMLTAEEKIAKRLDPSTGNLFHHFAAFEAINGSTRGSQGFFFGSAIGVWFNHLNQGLHMTGVGVSDTHGFFNLRAAGARTWTASPTDLPAAIDSQDVGFSVSAGRAVVGQGLFVTARLLATDGSGSQAALGWGDSTLVSSTNGVELQVRVQAPLYAAYDRVEIYANATTTATTFNEGVPVLFSAAPSQVISLTAEDVSIVDVAEGVPGGQRQETDLTVSYPDLTEDTWFVVVVRGSDGISPPLFPVMPGNLSAASNSTLADLLDGNLGESGVTALGITNPLYADVNGNPGFQAPLAPPGS